MWLSGTASCLYRLRKMNQIPSHEHKGYLSTARRAQCCYLLFPNGSDRTEPPSSEKICDKFCFILQLSTHKIQASAQVARAEIPRKFARTLLPFFVRLQGLHINKIYSHIKSYKQLKDFNSKTHVNSSLCLVAMLQHSIICISHMRFLPNTTKINKLPISFIF